MKKLPRFLPWFFGAWIAFASALAAPPAAAGWPGEVDIQFDPGSFDWTVHAAARQDDGKWIVAGDFNHIGDTARSGLARLNPDGSLDESFQDGLDGIGPGARAVAIETDGKILVGGEFGIVRLDSDGSLDDSFTNTVMTPHPLVSAIAMQPDGRILIGGAFTRFNRMTHVDQRHRIARLEANGFLDPSFGDPSSGANDPVFSIALLDNGKVLLGGEFTDVDGEPRNRIARLNPDGRVDTAFGAGMPGPDDRVNDIVALPDGRALIAGKFEAVHGKEFFPKIARLDSDGSLDEAFKADLPGASNEIHSIARQKDGKIVIGGAFGAVDSIARGNIARLGENGVLDQTFGDGLTGANGPVFTVVPGEARRVFAGGDFSAINEVPRTHAAVLHAGEAPPFHFFLSSHSVGENQPAGTTVALFSAVDPEEAAAHTYALVSGEGDAGNAFFTIEGNALKTSTVFDRDEQKSYTIRVQATNTGGTSVESVFEVRILAFPVGGRLHMDPSFDPGASINGSVTQVLRQSDGKWIVAGFFTAVHEAQRGGIARLNADGSTDHTFMDGMAGANGPVRSAAIQDDGKILIGGTFTEVNGEPRARIARLHPDGSLDPTFTATIHSGAAHEVRTLAVQDDGRILIGGRFLYIDGEPRTGIARLNPDGSLDPAFGNGEEGANDTVAAIALGPDGKVWVGGYFTTVNGESRRGIARLHPDGSLDETFGDGLDLAEGIVFAVAPLPDGKVLIGGSFFRVNGETWNRLARLHSDGTLDTSFGEDMPRPSSTVSAIALLEDGGMMVGGGFSFIHGEFRPRLARLHPDGAVDLSFGAGLSGVVGSVNSIAIEDDAAVVGGSFTGTHPYIARLGMDGELDASFTNGSSGPTGTVRVVAEQSDGKILIGGNFRDIQGKIRRGIARLHPDGTLDEPFGEGFEDTGGTVRSIIEEPDGRILVAGEFNTLHGAGRNRVARLNPDGSLDPFAKDLPWFNAQVYAMARQPDGKVIIGGNFQSIGEETFGRLARLNTDGSLDPDFAKELQGADDVISAIVVQPDGRILIGGRFANVHGEPRGRIARLHPDGSLDAGFGDGLAGASQPFFPPGQVSAIAVQDDGKILIGGNFSLVNGESRSRMARLNSDGTLDESFKGGIGETNNNVHSIAVQVDGRIVVGGAFTIINGEPRNRIARLHPDGSLDLGLSGADGSVLFIAVQNNADILIAGTFRAVNGTLRTRVARLFGGLPPWHGPPTDILLSNSVVPENRPAGRLVGVLAGVGPDEHETYFFELVSGEGDESNDLFAIEDDHLFTAATLEYETAGTHTIRVRATDTVSLSFERSFVIEVEQNRPPTDILLNNNVVPELKPAGTIVGTLTGIDPDDDDVHTFALVEGEGDNGNTFFVIEGEQLKTAVVLDYWEADSHTIRVRATDLGDLTHDKIFTVAVRQDAFRAWSESLPVGERELEDDPGGYGIPNLLRYAFAMDPLNPEREKLPQVGQTEIFGTQSLSITYLRRTDDSALRFIPEVSNNLHDWSSAPRGAPHTLIEDHEDGTETWSYIDYQRGDPPPRRFLRIRVER